MIRLTMTQDGRAPYDSSMSRLNFLIGTFPLALALVLPAAGAQQAAPPRAAEPVGQQSTSATEPPRPIEEGKIPTRAEHLEADLRRIEMFVQPAAEVVRIESALAAREVEIVALPRCKVLIRR